MAQVIKKRIVKVILWLVVSFFLLLAIVAGAIQFPSVQTRLVSYLSEELSEITGFDISLQRIAIDWVDQLHVAGLKVIDPAGNRLFYAADVRVNFELSGLLNKDRRNVDEITVRSAEIYLTHIPTDTTSTLNINQLIRKIRSLIRKQSTGRKFFSVDQFYLQDATLTYFENASSRRMRHGLDPKHFSIEHITGGFTNVRSMSDTLKVSVDYLSAHEYLSGLTVKNLATDFHISQHTMRFDDLSLEIGNSYITDNIVFNYESTRDLSDFIDEVTIEAHFRNTTINSRDIALFAPQVKPYRDRFKINGDFNGKIKAFVLDNTTVTFGSDTRLRGKVRMTGLPDFQETFINFDLQNSKVRIADLSDYLKENTYRRLEPLGSVDFSAEFIGFPNDFVANGDFYTDHGRIIPDINLKLREDINESDYSGALRLINFDLNGYTGNPRLGMVSLNGEIEGRGFTVERADFKLNGQIDEIGLNNYKYTNINTDARFTKEFFEGFLEIDDPNLKMTTTGSIDLRAGIDFFNLNAQIDTANFKALNITDDALFLSSQLQVNASGLQIDNIIGQANLLNTYVKYKDNELQLDSLQLISTKSNADRELRLLTNLIDIDVKGRFNYTTLTRDIQTLVKEYRLNFKNNKDSLDLYYAQKEQRQLEDYSLSYTINLKDANPLFELVAPDLYVAESTSIDGSFTGGYTSILSVNSQTDTVRYKDNVFIDDELQLNISKIADSTNVLAMAYIASQKQTVSDIETRDLIFEGIWNKNHIDFEFDIDQVAYDNNARLFGEVDFLAYETVIHFNPSDLQILDKAWKIHDENFIAVKKDEIIVDKLEIYSEDQKIAANGTLSKIDTEKELTLTVDSVKLENLNTILNQDLAGTINGRAEIKDYYNNMSVESNLTVERLSIDEFLVGDILGSNTWNNAKKQFDVNFFITRKKSKVLNLTGSYSPALESPLNLNANLNNIELNVLEPFFDSFFTHIKGTASGKLSITGQTSAPIINGAGQIQDAGLHVNYLNTNYNFNGGFFFKESKIGFTDVQIADSRDSEAQLAGTISHTNFKDFHIDIGGDFTNFLLLNTTSADNSLFYGTGVGSGNIQFVGPIRNMNIIAQATTEKDTRIFIPIGDSENYQQEEYINFVSLSDSLQSATLDQIEQVDLRGLKLDFDLEVTQDAYTEIIFDIKSGDIIRGRGNGDLKLQIDTKGEFNMFGDFEIAQGGYNFTLYNVINKEFEILPDSKISWYGDPYEGILDISATYNQLASLLPLMVRQENDTIYQESVEIRRKYPVKVLLDIDGPLLSPAVNFDISADNLPRNVLLANGEVKDLEFEFMAFKNRIDEQELKRQVFSLIVLRKFSPLQSFNTGGTITSSVSELFSNQLSYWITQVDENLEIDVDLGKLDQEAFNTFQLRLSYTFLDGRLRITRDGGFTNQENKADISSIAGDWTLEYLLTPDGKFKVKMYNRTNYNPINPNRDNQNTVTTGFSLIHTQSFNELKELFRKSRNKGIEEQEDNEDNEDTTDPTSMNREGLKEDDDEKS